MLHRDLSRPHPQSMCFIVLSQWYYYGSVIRRAKILSGHDHSGRRVRESSEQQDDVVEIGFRID